LSDLVRTWSVYVNTLVLGIKSNNTSTIDVNETMMHVLKRIVVSNMT